MIVAVVVGAAYYLVTRWDEVVATLCTIPWYSAVLSMLAVSVGLVMGAFSWRVIVNDLGASVGRVQGSQIYLVSQLGKYVPGSVWAYLLQMELGKKVGIPRARMFISTLVQIGRLRGGHADARRDRPAPTARGQPAGGVAVRGAAARAWSRCTRRS